MIDNVQDLLTHLTTIDAAAERKFNAYSRDMVRMRTDEITEGLTEANR
jgi:hypothetical protein